MGDEFTSSKQPHSNKAQIKLTPDTSYLKTEAELQPKRGVEKEERHDAAAE